MSQIIEGVDNEVTLTFTFLTVTAAVVIPWYFMRPQRAPSRTERGESLNEQNVEGTSGSSQPFVNQQGANIQYGPGLSQDTFRTSEHAMNRNDTDTTYTQNSQGLGFRPEFMPETGPGNARVETNNPGSDILITVRVKLISDTERPFQVSPTTTLIDFKRLCFPEEFSQGKLIRFIYSGRILQPDTETLQFFRIGDGCVVHAQISQQRSNIPSAPSAALSDDLDLSNFLVPFLTIALLLGWLAVFTVDGIFTWTSILILAFLTTMMLITSWL